MTRRTRLTRPLLAAVCVAALVGCASDRPKPAPLPVVESPIAGRQVWSARVGGVTFPLSLAVRQGRVHVAGDDGTVLALDVASGREAWRGDAGGRLAAGVGSDGRYAAVVTRAQELVVMDAGKVVWRKKLDAPVATAPLVAGERVFVLGVDRVVHAYDVLDGRYLWVFKRPGDALTLAQSGVLAAHQDTLLVGQGTRLVGLDPLRGTVRWDTALTTPRGTNEVERLADLVGPPVRQGSVFCMRAFQSAVGCIDAERGTLKWVQNLGGTEAVGGSEQLLFAADGSDRISARRRGSGELAWTSELLLNRALSAPAAVGTAVVFGDFEGHLHFLDQTTGKPVLRLPTDGSRIAAPPVLADNNTLLVATRGGGLYAFRPE
ncbi:outer membrane protein assembly factor BamB [Ideonella sp.]|uniref:outer membrane protein assembly factor BamB n=1 Tax=Ideonella sp. TaxID=1929293 RepID=UPI0035B2837B